MDNVFKLDSQDLPGFTGLILENNIIYVYLYVLKKGHGNDKNK